MSTAFWPTWECPSIISTRPTEGFSFRSDAPLDMRMNRNGGKTAADILADYPEEELSRLFRTYTDLKNPRALTSAIIRARAEAPVDTTFRLVEAARKAISPQREKKDLAQVFQALRIEVNDEMGSTQGSPRAGRRSTAPRRQTRSDHISFDRRPHGEKLHPQRKCRRNCGQGFLRKGLDSLETGEPIPGRSIRRRSRTESESA